MITDKGKLNALRLLLSFVAYLKAEDDVPPKMLSLMTPWFNGMGSVGNAMKLSKSTVTSIINRMQNNEWNDDLDEELLQLGQQLANGFSAITNDNAFKTEELSLIKDIGIFFRNGSDSSYNRINGRIRLAKSNIINQTWSGTTGGESVEPEQSQKPLINKISKIIPKLSDEYDDRYDIPIYEKEWAKENEPKLWDQYTASIKEARKIAKDFVIKYIRSQDRQHVPVKEIEKVLKKYGLDIHTIPKGFDDTITMNDSFQYFTKDGKHIPLAQTGGLVEMNPNYDCENDDSYVCKGKAHGAKDWQTYQTMDRINKNRLSRHSDVEEFAKNIENFRKKWLIDFTNSKDELTRTLALMTEIVYRVSPRVGNAQSAKGALSGNKVFGLSTLLKKHVLISQNRIRLQYPGKSNVMQKQDIKGTDRYTKLLRERMTELLEGKKPSDPVFTVNGKSVTSRDLNNYLKSKGSNVTVHKVRHAKADKLFLEILDKVKLKPGKTTTNEAQKWLKEQVGKIIAPALGHQSGTGKAIPTTSLGNYISPILQKRYYDHLQVHIPTYLEKLLR